MIDVVSDFFKSGKLLKQWNATILTLIRKKTNTTKITEFRPIFCCNTVYKTISRILADIFKQVLPLIISNTQSAFIPGRLMVENVLLATELVQGYNWKNISKRCMLKVDLKKAFDFVNWEFMLNTLQALNFPPNFINLIRQCITTTTFSLSINGEQCGYFKGSKAGGSSLSIPVCFINGSFLLTT